MNETLIFKTVVEATCEEVYAYYEKEEAINRLFPPCEKMVSLNKPHGLDVGGVVHLNMGYEDWIVRHTLCNKPYGYEDEQVIGPFFSFKHKHLFNKVSETQTEIIDQMEYVLSKEFLKRLIFKRIFKKNTEKMFVYRHKIMQEDFKQFNLSKRKPLKILISGASGFIGSQISMILGLFGDEVFKLVRTPSEEPRDIYWNPTEQKIDENLLEGFDVVIHLSGKSITEAWTKKNKKLIYESRVNSTKWLAHILNRRKSPPKVFLCASGCGFYGNRQDEELDENASKGEGFLAQIVEDWEKSAQEFTKGRVVCLRFGVVIGLQSGVLKKLLMPFKIGCGMIMGEGFQWMSWISVDDLAYQILHILKQENIQGPVNMTTPYPVTAKEFAKTLGSVLKRPVFFKFPPFLVKTLFGKKGEDLLLASTKAIPKKLIASGTTFSYPTLLEALKVYLYR